MAEQFNTIAVAGFVLEPIQPYLGNFPSLFYLDLSNNTLSGEIPQNLTRLQSLISRNISYEEPSPDFPLFTRRNLSARGLQYNQVLSFPPTLELSNNFLTGPIWPGFGDLKKLNVMDLKCNNLSGDIPSTLSGMTSIETLDLSHNNLAGTIPLAGEPQLFIQVQHCIQSSNWHNSFKGPICNLPKLKL